MELRYRGIVVLQSSGYAFISRPNCGGYDTRRGYRNAYAFEDGQERVIAMPNDLDFSLDYAVPGDVLLGGTGRLGRMAWLGKQLRENDLYLLQDGALSKLIFNEVLECFISGQFIATIILGFSFIERTIAGRLSHVGEKAASKGSSEELIATALQRNWLTKTEHDHINELRTLRNPIVHFREHLAETRPEVKAALNARSTAQMLETDAKQILEAAIHVLGKTAL